MAAELHLSSAVFSEALSELEAEMVVTLAHRTTRSFALTPLDGAVLKWATATLDAADAAVTYRASTQANLSGAVRISASTELAAIWLPPLLKPFEAACPDVQVEMQVDDRPPSLGAGPIDMAISAGYDLNPQSTSRSVALLPLALVATPDLIAGGPARETLLARIKRVGFVGRPSICADAAELWALPTYAPQPHEHSSEAAGFPAFCRE